LDRVPYRRVTPPRNDRQGNMQYGYGREEQGEITPGETVIMQCIISGILMVVVLIICLVEIAPAITMREGLSEALSGSTTVNELMTDIRAFGEEWLDWGGQSPTPEAGPIYAPGYIQPGPETTVGLEMPLIPLPPAAISPEYYFPLTSYPEGLNP